MSKSKVKTVAAKAPAPKPAPKPASELVRIPERVVREREENASLIATIALLAADPKTDIEKMEKLWNIHKEMTAAKAELEFNISKNALQPLLPVIKKNGNIEFTDKNKVDRKTPYALREDIEKAIRPLYTQAGFSTEYDTETLPDGKIITVLILRHTSGFVKHYRTPPMMIDTSGSKNNNQGAGSTMEYGKRYAITGAFNIITEGLDDDGNNGQQPGGKQPDKFAEKVAQEAGNGKVIDAKATPIDPIEALKGYGKQLSDRLSSEATNKRRGEILMKNIKLVNELEEAGLADIVKDIRNLAEAGANE